MSKTIIISTDELVKLLKPYLDASEMVDNVFCENCHKKNGNKCIVEDGACPYSGSDEVYTFIIDKLFSNYMIPFS